MSISLVIARRRPKVVDEVTPSSRGAREAGDVAVSFPAAEEEEIASLPFGLLPRNK